jgi:Fe-S cluster assembly protein SufD
MSTVSEIGGLGVQPSVDRTSYLTDLLNLRSVLSPESSWLQAVRDRATFLRLEIPSTRNEEWRFTDLSPLLQIKFQAVRQQPSTISRAQIESAILPEATHRLVFLDGIYAPELSAIAPLDQGVTVSHLATASPALQQQVLKYLAGQPGGEEVFTALNTASLSDAAVLWIPQNQVMDAPIHLLFIATGTTAAIAQPRCLVVAEANSSVTLVEEYMALQDGTYFTNSVTELWLAENTQVNHTRVQRDSLSAIHIGKTAVSQARDSRYTCNAITLGAKLSRHNLEIHQTGEQTQTTLNGLTLIAGEQIADTHSAIAYTKPHGISRQIHKCIIDDHAHAIFNGKVSVPKLAQLTDAGQISRNLLLSPKARIDTKPQLEITADNVKCSHGATVSQLESDEVFYLQSRGIDETNARKLLIYGFAYDVISQIPVASLRDHLAAIVQTYQA